MLKLKKCKFLYPVYSGIILSFFFVISLSMIPLQISESNLKARFIEKFVFFTEWPKNSISSSFKIGVIGKSTVFKELNLIAQKQKMRGFNVNILLISDINQVQDVNLLFIESSERRNLPAILAMVRGKPILTVADASGFSEQGVHFNFYRNEETLRFEINLETLKESGLKVDVNLLALGNITKH